MGIRHEMKLCASPHLISGSLDDPHHRKTSLDNGLRGPNPLINRLIAGSLDECYPLPLDSGTAGEPHDPTPESTMTYDEPIRCPNAWTPDRWMNAISRIPGGAYDRPSAVQDHGGATGFRDCNSLVMEVKLQYDFSS